MQEQLIIFFAYAAIFIWIILFAEFIYRKFEFETECTRKIVHIGTGTIALTAPMFGATIYIVLGLTILFSIIFYISRKIKMFPAIFNIKRESYGELLFGWSSFFLFVIYKYTGQIIFFYLPFSVVVYADSAAALAGRFFPIKRYSKINKDKSFGGSLAFFFIAFFLSFFLLPSYGQVYRFFFSFYNAFILTTVEAISTKGWDNFYISMVSAIPLYGIL